MAELLLSNECRCKYFFLYDGSRVRGECDLTREGICYFYPEQTPLDKQELLCGQLAGVGRCISELSLSPVRTLQLQHSKFAIRMSDDFLWALGCSVEVPTVSVCDLLDQLINLFCFYNGSVRRTYQLNSKEFLASRWARYLSHLLSGSSEFHCIFSSLKTIDSTNVDPLLLLKAALILQACQRCPLVLGGCILFRGRVVSTQMSPELTMKVMVYDNETFAELHRHNGPSGDAVSSTEVFLTTSELQYLQSTPVDKNLSSHSTPHKDAPKKKTRLSRTLSDTPSIDSDPTDSSSSLLPQIVSFNRDWSESELSMFNPSPGPTHPLDQSQQSHKTSDSNERLSTEMRQKQNLLLKGSEKPTTAPPHPQNGDIPSKDVFATRACRNEVSHDKETSAGHRRGSCESVPNRSGSGGSLEDDSLIPMRLYIHRVKGLVLALLVEPPFLSDTASMEEVYHSSLASLNGLEAHLRTISPGASAAPELYIFSHFDLIQRTLTSNLSGRPGSGPEHLFVRATSLLHSHFCNTETLQEAIIRSASTAVYGTRSVAQETFFQLLGPSLRNSGIPNQQDSAFSLPSKARHRLLKHGVNLL